MAVKQWKVSEPWLNTRCKLGENPFYEPQTNTLRFVDIIAKALHTVPLTQGPPDLQTLQLHDAVGCSADIEGPDSGSSTTLIVGAKYGFAYLDRSTGALSYITKPAQLWNQPGEDAASKCERMRANDGNIDPQGRFWVGMMNDQLVQEPGPEGAVFVLEADGRVRRAIDKVTIPNGIGWSADGRTMYYVDSPTKAIWAYAFDGATGEIRDPREWWKVGDDLPADAVPDGFCQDTEGAIWVAIHGGSKVVRLKEDGAGKGIKVGEVLLPTRCPTCPRIAGTELFVTSSEEGNPDKYPDSVELAGAVFKVDVGVSGIDMNRWHKRGHEALGTDASK